MSRKKKNHDKIVFLANNKLNITTTVISEALVDSYSSHEEFVSMNDVLKEYNEMKETIKNLTSFLLVNPKMGGLFEVAFVSI